MKVIPGLVIPGLYVVAIVATLMVSIRWGYEQYYLHTYKRAKAGHLCSRLARMGYISILDRKFLNYGWFVSQYLHTYGTESAIIKEYINNFYEVPDRDIKFDRVVPQIKSLIQDLKENGERDILHDIMSILKTNVNLNSWLQNKKRAQLWNNYWNNVDKKII